MVKVELEVLRDALEKVSSVVESSQLNEIMGCVLVTLEGDQLEFIGSDASVQISTSCKVKESKGKSAHKSFAVNVRKFAEIVRFSSSKEAAFKVDNTKMSLEVGSGRYTLAIREGAEFPTLDLGKTNLVEVSLPQASLHAAFKRLQASISVQTHRAYLAGAFFDFRDGSLHLVGTDGHRLATDEFETQDAADASFILPRKAVMELMRIIDPESDEQVNLVLSKDGDNFRAAEFRFTENHLRLTAQLIPNQYPDYSKVIPDEKTNDSHLVFDREALLESVRQVSSVHDRTGDTIKLIAKKGEELVEIVGEGAASKDFAQIDLNLSNGGGFDLKLQVNSTYMKDMLTAFEGFDKIDVALKDSQSSIVCRPAGDKKSKLVYVVMPVR